MDEPSNERGVGSGHQATKAVAILVHPSDRSVQYASAECVAILKKHGTSKRGSRSL